MEYRGLTITERRLGGCCRRNPNIKYYKIILEPLKKSKDSRRNPRLFKGIDAARVAVDGLFKKKKPKKASTQYRRVYPG
jgi:hypothetical protein